jgi:ABC-type multidrug transport system ATPase subunit/ABC-type multidrug transport system permease subunit
LTSYGFLALNGAVQGHRGEQDGRAGAPLTDAPPASVLRDGRQVPVPPAGLSIGRRSDNDIVLPSDRSSRHHAQISSDAGRWFVADLGSMNGTYVNGERLTGESRWLTSGDTVTVGGEVLRFVTGDETRFGAPVGPPARSAAVAFTGGRMRIGRDAANEIVVDDPNVSRFHAEVAPEAGGLVLRDLGSTNGTRLDGVPIGNRPAPIRTGAQIGVGSYRLLLDGGRLLAHNDRGAMRLDARRVTVVAGGKQILDGASLSIVPGELVALIGESGSGKTTLLKALAGVATPTSGSITVSGEPVAARGTDIGYVPQTDIVHPQLTVREALRFSARLRLPDDATQVDVEHAVDGVIAEVALEEHADTRIGSLSGGQRKRAGVAVELLGRPSLLFLDEPTTGLDPELETRLMRLLRTLAGSGRAIAVVTHATKNLSLCDKLAVMGRGGQLAFYGPPAAALEFFQVGSYDEIYRALLERPSVEWRQRFETQASHAAHDPVPIVHGAAPTRRSGGRQARVLAARYLRLLVRDRRNVAILLGQVPLLALGMAGLFPADVFATGRGHAGNSAQLLFLLVITSVWLGSIDAAREIVKERSVLDRERAAGVRLGAYVASKTIVLFALAAVQTLVLAAIVLALRPLHAESGAYVQVVVLLLLTSFVAVAMGLLISAWVRSQDQATSFIPLALIPQLFFAGAIVGVEKMGEPVGTLSKLAFAQWSFAGGGTAIDMESRIAADRPFAKTNGFGPDFFDLGLAPAILVLLAFLAVVLAGVGAVLKRRRPA